MSGLAVLNALTMLASVSESGGVWLVQNLTSVAPDAQAARACDEGDQRQHDEESATSGRRTHLSS